MAYKVRHERTIYYDPISGFSVISVKTADKNVPANAVSKYRSGDRLTRFTATGYYLPLTDAFEVAIEGEWTETKRGCQLSVSRWEEIISKTPEGVRAYLACGLFAGVGAKTAADIVERFGAGALDILEKSPERLLEIKGITAAKLEKIKDSYAQSVVIRDLMTWLAPFKITPNAALKIQREFGARSASVIRESPYELCRIAGFGFVKVDDIARKTGLKPNDHARIRGALFYTLDQSRSGAGHLCLEMNDLREQALGLLNNKLPESDERVQAREVSDELYDIVSCGALIADSGMIYLPRCFKEEDSTARHVAETLAAPSLALDISVELARARNELGIELSAKQETALSMVFNHNLSIITGSPGTGKTTIIKVIIELYRRICKGKILLAAPTGRASRRMGESTGFQNTKTLHSALGLVSGDEDKGYLNKKEALDYGLVVIDEFSMTDMWLASELFTRLKPGTKVLLVGDADQLPSVGAGNVFKDLIASGIVSVTALDEIFRQSKDSLIACNAKLINEGKTKLYYGEDFVFIDCDTPARASDIIQRLYMDVVRREGCENIQILSPYKEDGEASADKLNQAIRELINPYAQDKPEIKAGQKTFRVNDRVIQTKNKGEVSNGDVGYARSIHKNRDGEQVMTVAFSGERLVDYTPSDLGVIELAYAMTIHKGMGSEYETVIIPVLSSHMIMLHRNLIYTAITRARKRVYLVGQKSSLFLAIHRNKISKRNTMLGQRIKRYYQAMDERRELIAV